MREGAKPIQKEKLIFEGGKFCLDMAKLILGGVVLASVMQQDVNVWLLVSIGLGAVLAFVVFGFILIGINMALIVLFAILGIIAVAGIVWSHYYFQKSA